MKKLYTLLLVLSFFQMSKNVFAVPTITTDSILQLSTCAGGNIIVPFTVTGGNFTFGNVFTAQLSDMFGQFNNPVNIGTLTWFTSGIIFATIPQNTNFSFLYKIRVIANNPAVTGTPCPNTLIVTQIAQLNQITALPPTNYICPGDTITLFAVNPATAYSWNTGATTASIQVTQAGIYSVTTTDILTCVSTAYDTLYTSCTGITETEINNHIVLYPNPAEDKLNINFENTVHGKISISIFDALGKGVFFADMPAFGNATAISISNFNSGLYFITISGNGFYTRERFIKK